MATMQEVVTEIATKLESKAEKNKGINAVFQFDIGGDDPMSFYFKLDDGVPTYSEGAADNANVTISMAAPDFKKMAEGKLSGTMAFMTGKLKIKGDMSLATKIESILLK
ncbi:MAG: SCP2 sterol-binding domain-containing protein [Bacillota bacterium]